MKVALQTVECWRDVRGPGQRNQSEVTTTFSTMKVRSGEKDSTPTGLSIVWDQEARAVILSKDASQDPVVVIAWENVRRAIPADPAGFMQSMDNLPDLPDVTEVKPKNAGLAAMQKKNAAK